MNGTEQQHWSYSFGVLSLVAGVALAGMQRAGAQTSLTDIAGYEGADRSQRLEQGARKEAELVLYTSMSNADNGQLIAAYQKKFGVKVRIWRAGSDVVLQRVLTEHKVNRVEADVILMDATGLEPLRVEKALQAIKSPMIAGLLPKAVPAHHEWLPVYLNGFVQGYNTKAIKKESLPRTWADLTKPEWKGKLGIEGKDEDWLAEVVLSMGEAEGLKLFRQIATTNGVSVRIGHTLLTNLIASGEVPLGLTPYDYSVEQRKVSGAPVDWFLIPPAIARASGVGVVKTAKHPNAAVQFVDFALGDGQKLLADRQFTTVSTKLDPPFLRQPVTIIDPAVTLERSQRWTALFRKTFQ